MNEIANNIFLEERSAGIVLGVFRLNDGLLTIDAPLKADDQQSWRHHLAQLDGRGGQLMVMLDTNMDRLLGMHFSTFPALAHETALEIIQNLPSSLRIPEMQVRSDSEAYDQSQGVRWRLPNMTFSKQVSIHWDDRPITMIHQPGAHRAAIWVHDAAEKVVFIGDSVVIDQPPFLECCQLDLWLEELKWLNSDQFQDYKIISGRNGMIEQREAMTMYDFLSIVKAGLEELCELDKPEEDVEAIAASLLGQLSINHALREQYHCRLVWGLRQLLKQHHAAHAEEIGRNHVI